VIPAPFQRRRAFLATAGALLALGVPGAAFGGVREPPKVGAAAKPTAPKSGPPAPKNLEPLPPAQYTGILGKKVTDADGKDIGLLVDVIVGADRTPRAAVIDFGGFLGVGSRKIAVDWRLVNFAPGRIWLSLDRAEIQGAPEYRPGGASDEMVGPPWLGPLSPPSGK
jgi:PRC-barrel domain